MTTSTTTMRTPRVILLRIKWRWWIQLLLFQSNVGAFTSCYLYAPLHQRQQQQQQFARWIVPTRRYHSRPLATLNSLTETGVNNKEEPCNPNNVTSTASSHALTIDVSSMDMDETKEEEEDQQQQDNDETYQVAFRNTILSIAVALLFGAGLWATAGPVVGEEYFAGYIVEKSLSVDNLFVFLLLFDYFQIPTNYQGRILNWGIFGSVVMRAIMIGLGATALQHFRGILLVFAGILIYSAVQVLIDVEEDLIEKDTQAVGTNPVVMLSRYLCESNELCDLEELDAQATTANPIVLFSHSLFPSTNVFDGDRFFTIQDGVKKATPLFVCMIAVELSDVVFAVDSIPAVFGVTENPWVVFSSNMFAILGLRSLYPVLSKAATDLKYLEPAVAVILAFIGGKMIAEYFEYIIPTEVALAVILSLLGTGVGASVFEKRSREQV